MRFLNISMVMLALGVGAVSAAKASTDWGEWMEARNNVDRGLAPKQKTKATRAR